MRVGHAARDITPEPGITLSGFVARRDQPSRAVDDPLFVHALAIEEDGEVVLLLVFDLLALGPEITAEIRAALDGPAVPGLSARNIILCCTHTHSAPATIKLIGCGIPERGYWDLVVRAAADAAAEALAGMRPAGMRSAVQTVSGVSRNRRNVLADGRVVMAAKPDAPVVRTGPTWDRMLLVRFDDDEGKGIAGVASWAAHPCVVCSQNISADYPGELRRRLSRAHGAPFLYLQGAGGNLNLPFLRMTREEMLKDVEELMERLRVVSWSAPAAPEPFGVTGKSVRLSYRSIPSLEALTAIRDGMGSIAERGSGAGSVTAVLADILNLEPGERPDDAMLRHTAGAIARWAGELVDGYDRLPESCDAALNVWVLGPLVFCVVPAEVFVETAIDLQNSFPERVVTVVGYASPLIGYLPTDEALDEGGYEVEYAYRFYGHPGPFARGSEPAVVRALKRMIASVTPDG